MKKFCCSFMLFSGIFLAVFSFPGILLSQSPKVYIATVDNQIIHSATLEYLLQAIQKAEEARAECLVIQLDTPGGLLESTHILVKAIMNAHVPVVVYVAPSGARAGSAGVFITYAAHIAAMAPSTHIGAAHPIALGEGGRLKRLVRRFQDEAKKGDELKEEIVEEEKDPLSEKIVNDTLAWIGTIAKSRHRNEAWARKAVAESVSITEEDALKENVVNIVATNFEDLFRQIHGKEIVLPSGNKILNTKDAECLIVSMTSRQRILAVIGHPNIAYFLMLFGFLGLLFEFTHPGVGFPGIGGAICLVLSLYAMQTLPTNYAAVFLIALGILLLVFELKVMSHGLLTLGGVVALTLGSLMLYDTPYSFMRVSLHILFPIVAATTLIVTFLVGLAFRAHRNPVTTGKEGLVGSVGVAQTDISPRGDVFIHGELWQAESKEPIKKGSKVKVVSLEGLTLQVKPVK
ncbi:MAG: nodulation protein NfeD [Candidatus Omnitrophota bacterium]